MEILLRNQLAETPKVRAALDQFAAQHQVPSAVVLALDLALEELVTNIISYGYVDPLEHVIHLRIEADQLEIRVRLEDDGKPFDPCAHAVPQLDLPMDQKPIGGLGLHMVRQSVDRMEYERLAGKNVVTLVKRISSRADPV